MTDPAPTPSTPPPPLRYALIFRIHFWDAFADRQLARARAAAPGADLWVLVDETRGRVEGIPGDRVFRLTDGQILDAGYVAAGEGSIQWFSGDVPLYMFRAAQPDYDLYVQMEYDVNFHLDVDAMAAAVKRDGADMVALTKGEPVAQWPWLATCLDAYRPDEIRHQLICLSAFSGAALDRLAAARLAQAAAFRAGELRAWPYCEGFLPTEAARQGLRLRELSDYGDVTAYDWWPPYPEGDLSRLGGHAFVHPVLDADRYVPSLFKHPPGLAALLWPGSWFGRKLRRLGLLAYLRLLAGSRYRTAVLTVLGRRLAALRGR
jgi:hypothetical protein